MSSCNDGPAKATIADSEKVSSFAPGTFGFDREFLAKHDSTIILRADNAAVIVSAKYQAKVFTSTADGDGGKSFGWINYKAFDAALDPHMNAYGGENRFWLGPEGNMFSLFFEKGKDMVFDNWKTPAPIDSETWQVVENSDQSVSMSKAMRLRNYMGTELKLKANRRVSILSRDAILSTIQMTLDTGVRAVAYRTENSITNTGEQPWTEESGMPCIWILDMFSPSSSTVVIVPFRKEAKPADEPVATTDYFGKVPPERIAYKDSVLLFVADGKQRGKIGLGPKRAKQVAGSYDAENRILTITFFDVDRQGRYLNQEWNTKKPIFRGDAVNAYNDGPLEDGSQMGPFYEIESVSPAAALRPGETLSHMHSVFHFTGDEDSLNQLCMQMLGISIGEVRSSFQSK